jgi:hypothetical protein
VAAVRWAGDAPLAAPAEGPRWGVGWTLDGTLRLHAQWPGAVRLVLPLPDSESDGRPAPTVIGGLQSRRGVVEGPAKARPEWCKR